MEKFNFKNRIQSNPRLLRLKNPTTGEIIDYEIQDLQESEIVENGTEMTAEVLNEMQSNIEESCVAVSPTQPKTNEKVWFKTDNNSILVKNDNGVYERFIQEEKIQEIPLTDVLQMKEGYSILSAYKLYKDRNRIFGNIVIKKDSGYFLTDIVANFKKIPRSITNTGCFLGNDEWKTQAVGYVYWGGTNLVVADINNGNYSYAKIYLDIITD